MCLVLLCTIFTSKYLLVTNVIFVEQTVNDISASEIEIKIKFCFSAILESTSKPTKNGGLNYSSAQLIKKSNFLVMNTQPGRYQMWFKNKKKLYESEIHFANGTKYQSSIFQINKLKINLLMRLGSEPPLFKFPGAEYAITV